MSSISANNVSQSLNAYGLQQRRQDFGALSQALQSGDLAGVQKAYASLNQKFSGGDSSAATGASSTSTHANDFSQLGQALQSGDLAGAQKAFAAMKKDPQNAHAAQGTGGGQQTGQVHHHGHYHVASSAQATELPVRAWDRSATSSMSSLESFDKYF